MLCAKHDESWYLLAVRFHGGSCNNDGRFLSEDYPPQIRTRDPHSSCLHHALFSWLASSYKCELSLRLFSVCWLLTNLFHRQRFDSKKRMLSLNIYMTCDGLHSFVRLFAFCNALILRSDAFIWNLYYSDSNTGTFSLIAAQIDNFLCREESTCSSWWTCTGPAVSHCCGWRFSNRLRLVGFTMPDNSTKMWRRWLAIILPRTSAFATASSHQE